MSVLDRVDAAHQAVLKAIPEDVLDLSDLEGTRKRFDEIDQLHVYPGAFHGSDNQVSRSLLSRRWRADERAALDRALNRSDGDGRIPRGDGGS
jgi:hypothetical protein